MNDLTDFNDLGNAEGLEAVADIVNQAIPATMDTEPDQEPPQPPPAPAWPEPMIPGTIKTPDIPLNILPGPWGAMARAVSEATQTPAALAVMCCLGVLATLVQRRFEVAPKGDQYIEPLSLWCASVSPSGTRKTAVMGAFHAPILKWEKAQADRFRVLIARANAARSTAKKRIEAMNQQAAKCKEPAELKELRDRIEQEELDMPDEVKAPRLFTTSATAERAEAMLCEQSERVSVHSDEPGIFRIMGGAYSGGSQNIDVFLSGHAGSTIRVDRASRTAHVDKPAISFNVMIQPGLMAELAGSKGFRDSGLIARFLWVVPVSNVGRRDVRKGGGIPADVSAAYAQAVNGLLYDYLCEPGTVPKAQTLTLTDAAMERWLVFSQYVEDRSDPGGEFSEIHDWASKLAGAAARIAAVLELARDGVGAQEVQFDSMDNAVNLCMALIPHAMAAYGLLGADPVGADAMAILEWSKRFDSDVFTQRDAKQAMRGRFPSDEKFKKASDRLIELDCVRYFNRSEKGRRPSVAFRLNPALLRGI